MKGKFLKPEDQEHADRIYNILKNNQPEKPTPSKEERIVWAVIKYTLLYPAGILFIATLWIGAYNRLSSDSGKNVPVKDNRSSETLKSSDTARRVTINGDSVHHVPFRDGDGWIKYNPETEQIEFQYWNK